MKAPHLRIPSNLSIFIELFLNYHTPSMTTEPHHYLTGNSKFIIHIILVLVSWFFIWFISQFLFFFGAYFPLLSEKIFSSQNVNLNFSIITAWILLVGVSCFLLYEKATHDISFIQQIHNKKILYFYAIPIILIFRIIFQGTTSFGANGLLYVVGMTVSVFWQQILTFGLLQTYLEKLVNTKLAMFMTILIFTIGHLPFLNLSLLTPIEFGGFILFGLLRHQFKTIHPGYIIHLSFSLLI